MFRFSMPSDVFGCISQVPALLVELRRQHLRTAAPGADLISKNSGFRVEGLGLEEGPSFRDLRSYFGVLQGATSVYRGL